MLSDHDRAVLSWFDRMAKATANLQEHERISLSAWLAAGEKRSSWPGWESIIGALPSPPEAKKAQPERTVEMPKARRAC